MKIKIESTTEETKKSAELVSSMFPMDTEELPTEKQTIQINCNIMSINGSFDPNGGFSYEVELKTHFILWIIRKMKPFITMIKSMIEMFSDLFEDISIMAGDVTVIENGKKIGCDEADQEEESEDEEYEDDAENLKMNPAIYRVVYLGTTASEVYNNTLIFNHLLDASTFIEYDEVNGKFDKVIRAVCITPGYEEQLRQAENINGAIIEYRNWQITCNNGSFMAMNRRIQSSRTFVDCTIKDVLAEIDFIEIEREKEALSV